METRKYVVWSTVGLGNGDRFRIIEGDDVLEFADTENMDCVALGVWTNPTLRLYEIPAGLENLKKDLTERIVSACENETHGCEVIIVPGWG